jgi:hypothetical protein
VQDRELAAALSVAFPFEEKRNPVVGYDGPLPSALRPGYPHVSLIEDRSIAFFAATSLLSFLRKGTLRWINIGKGQSYYHRKTNKIPCKGG